MVATLNDQIREVQREIALRERVYPKWIKDGRMEQAEADQQLAAMRASFQTLAGVQALFDRASGRPA